jgi:hypothetical protein
LRLAREGEQLGYAAGQRPMDAQNRSLWLIKMSLTSGRARISEFPPAELHFVFPVIMAIRIIRQIDRACRSLGNRALSNALESSGIAREWCGKVPDASSDRRDCGILNDVGFNASDQETSLSAVDGSPGSPPMSARIDRSRIQQSFL